MLNTTLMQANHQWSTRPVDERFESLIDLDNAMKSSRARSSGKVISSRALNVVAPNTDSGDHKTLQIIGPNGHAVNPTHWSFGQLATLAGAPAGYLRDLPAGLAADCLNIGLHVNRDIEDVGVLVERDAIGSGLSTLKAATGPRYGRVWNADITGALVNKFGDGISGDWKVPGEFGHDVAVTKANTTLFGSDRNMFVFLADEHNRIEVDNRRGGKPGSLARGFFVWNSEVGAETIGAAFFMFDYVCCNRIVWGVEGFKEMRLRHTAGTPDKWLREVSPVLIEYANAKASPIEAQIKAAQSAKVDDMAKFMASRQFTGKAVKAISAAHEREENRPMETLWDVATGITAYAKTIEYQDARVDMERQAGKVLELVAA